MKNAHDWDRTHVEIIIPIVLTIHIHQYIRLFTCVWSKLDYCSRFYTQYRLLVKISLLRESRRNVTGSQTAIEDKVSLLFSEQLLSRQVCGEI